MIKNVFDVINLIGYSIEIFKLIKFILFNILISYLVSIYFFSNTKIE
jgi:hypothetical protein